MNSSTSSLRIAWDIDGTNLTGVRCQISGTPELQFEKKVEAPGCLECPLPNGMPPAVWIVLSRGNTWFDYAHLNSRWSPFNEQQVDVLTTPSDFRTQVQELIAQGEGLTIEFKQEVPRQNDQMLKTVAAFANGGGGVILLGIADTGEIVGVKITGEISREKDRIINALCEFLVHRRARRPSPPGVTEAVPPAG